MGRNLGQAALTRLRKCAGCYAVYNQFAIAFTHLGDDAPLPNDYRPALTRFACSGAPTARTTLVSTRIFNALHKKESHPC